MILAKAAMSHEQIKAKLKEGCDGIEIQLLDELTKSNGITLEEAFDLCEFMGYPIKVVHAPLIPGQSDPLLEQLCTPRDFTILHEACKLADLFGKRQGIVVPVIIHSESFLGKLKDIDTCWKNVEYYVNALLKEFSNITLLIENVSPLRGLSKNKIDCIHLSNNFMFDNVELVKELRKSLHTNKIGTVLDTCHQMITEKFINAMYDLLDDVPRPDLSIEAFFKMNKGLVEVIHLSDMAGYGYGEGKHGISFCDDRYDVLCHILSLKEKYAPNAYLTLEITEPDYIAVPGFKETKRLVNKYYAERADK